MPIISVVMCCYNEERYIRESIDAVLGQTYQDYEFILWNDGSTDKTEEIIKSYNDERIRYFYHENTGLGEALRLACQEATGKYIARIDCDDICMPNRFEKQVAFLETHPDYVLCSSGVFYIDENGETTGRRFPATWDSIIRKKLNAITHPAAMFRTDAYRNAGGYLPLKSAQDRILWSRMLRYGKFANLPYTLIKYREISTSVSHIIENSPYWGVIKAIRMKMCSDVEINIEDVRLHNEIYAMAKREAMGLATMQISKRQSSVEERLFSALRISMTEDKAISLISLFKNVFLTLYLKLKNN